MRIPSRAELLRHPQVADAVVTLILLIIMALLMWTDLPETVTGGDPVPGQREWAPYLVGAVMLAPLALRRRWPCTVAVVVASGLLAFRLLEIPEGLVSSVAFYIAVYSAGKYGGIRSRHWTRAYAGLVLVALWAWSWAVLGGDVVGTPGMTFLVLLSLIEVLGFAAVWVIGDLARRTQQRTEDLLKRTLELEIERERSAQQATTAERLRIARELHDALGHHISVMGVQAAGARRILPPGSDRADDALAAIEESARRAVTELQRTLALLHRDGDEPVEKQATIERLPGLIDDVRQAGIGVTLQMDHLPELPPSLELATARIIQEALTNTLRHAGPGSSAWVHVRRLDDRIRVVVGDDGRGHPVTNGAAGNGAGRGLVGLRERVELHGGRFEAGPHGEGFEVSADLPLPDAVLDRRPSQVQP